MHATKTAALDSLISQLDTQILHIEGLGIPGTKLLLTMARLDLQAKRHNIADHELKALCSSIEHAIDADRGRRRRTRAARSGKRTRFAARQPLPRVASDRPRAPA
ncbi:MAG TPA: hypothetical protein VK281_06375 [Xanthobacteraceae bacterium]|nr:hypothetical protein [Xanthobacteraceae bacterium]